jgi:hypothetical protein
MSLSNELKETISDPYLRLLVAFGTFTIATTAMLGMFAIAAVAFVRVFGRH